MNINVSHSKRREALFEIEDDKIRMPFKCSFRKMDKISREQNYYITLFHELIHWTGHSSRLSRKSLISYDDDKKSKDHNPKMISQEELTAELGANLLMKFFKLQEKPNDLSLSFIKQELSYFDLKTQKIIYTKALKESKKAFTFIIKRYEEYVQQKN